MTRPSRCTGAPSPSPKPPGCSTTPRRCSTTSAGWRTAAVTSPPASRWPGARSRCVRRRWAPNTRPRPPIAPPGAPCWRAWAAPPRPSRPMPTRSASSRRSWGRAAWKRRRRSRRWEVFSTSAAALDDAERSYRRALDIRQSILDPQHFDLAMTENNLGMLLAERGATARSAHAAGPRPATPFAPPSAPTTPTPAGRRTSPPSDGQDSADARVVALRRSD